jgi:hypothetical protein
MVNKTRRDKSPWRERFFIGKYSFCESLFTCGAATAECEAALKGEEELRPRVFITSRTRNFFYNII